jgi:predicted protein tyrosine phosphatase
VADRDARFVCLESGQISFEGTEAEGIGRVDEEAEADDITLCRWSNSRGSRLGESRAVHLWSQPAAESDGEAGVLFLAWNGGRVCRSGSFFVWPGRSYILVLARRRRVRRASPTRLTDYRPLTRPRVKCKEPVTPELLASADVIFVMEKSHRNKLLKQFRASVKNQKIVVLGITDDYEYIEPSSSAGPFGHLCTRPAPASQERGPDSPHGLPPVDPSFGQVGLFERLVPPHLGIRLKQGQDPDVGG